MEILTELGLHSVREGPGAEVDGGVWGRGQRVRVGKAGWVLPHLETLTASSPLPTFARVRDCIQDVYLSTHKSLCTIQCRDQVPCLP